jgi:hypothetical protein
MGIELPMTFWMVSLVSTTPDARPWRKRADRPIDDGDELAVRLRLFS